MASLVMTILGEDRPGVVESVAKAVNDHGANWLESRMAHLAGQFAGIVHVEVDSAKSESLVRALRSLDQQGLTVIVQAEVSTPTSPIFAPLQLEVVGGDRPGIVREVTHVLADRKVNVEEFQTECVAAPMTGDRLFRATAQLRMPAGLTVQQLQHDLEQIAHDLMVDIRLKSADA
jgi:glycine cleavage system regulatory protein